MRWQFATIAIDWFIHVPIQWWRRGRAEKGKPSWTVCLPDWSVWEIGGSGWTSHCYTHATKGRHRAMKKREKGRRVNLHGQCACLLEGFRRLEGARGRRHVIYVYATYVLHGIWCTCMHAMHTQRMYCMWCIHARDIRNNVCEWNVCACKPIIASNVMHVYACCLQSCRFSRLDCVPFPIPDTHTISHLTPKWPFAMVACSWEHVSSSTRTKQKTRKAANGIARSAGRNMVLLLKVNTSSRPPQSVLHAMMTQAFAGWWIPQIQYLHAPTTVSTAGDLRWVYRKKQWDIHGQYCWC